MAEIIVALDVPTAADARRLVARLGPELEFVKVGLELFTREGPPVVRMLREQGLRVFLDLKLHDIPHTVAAAVRAARELDVDLLTVHASGGPRMLAAAAEAAGTGTSGPAIAGSGMRRAGLQLLAVTVLTSLASDELAGPGAATRHPRAPGTRCSGSPAWPPPAGSAAWWPRPGKLRPSGSTWAPRPCRDPRNPVRRRGTA
jgi:orotidine-5'-phosphate decarboxylase